MNAILGNLNKFYLKVGNASSYTWLAGEQNNSFNRTQEAIEVSDKSSTWAKFIAGKKGATIEVTVFADNEDAAQVEALRSLHEGRELDFFVGQLSTASTPAPTSGDAGKAIATNISDTNDYGAVSSRSMSLTVSGEPTHYPSFTA